MKYSAVIVAAGNGSRMGLGYNKILYELEPNVRVIDKSIQLFKEDENCEEIIVVLSEIDYDIALDGVKKVLGGKTRCESVYHGLKEVTSDYVLIHDGAIPYLKKESVEALCSCLKQERACILAIKERDTLKKVENGYITDTINRDVVWHAQTPQAFETALIRECIEKAIQENSYVTDDASVVELYGNVRVKIVEGDVKNIKLTIKEDLEG